MTTDVKVTCNGPNYRAVVYDSRYLEPVAYVYSGKDGAPNPVSSHHVGSNSKITVTEEYSETGWNTETHERLTKPPAAEMTDAPVSLGEVRASKARDGRLWSPREMLVSFLRDMDDGRITPRNVVVAYDTETTTGHFRQACASLTDSIGVIELAKQQIMAQSD